MEGEHNAVTWNHAFGVQSASGAVSYLDEANMLYPVGRHLAICAPMDLKNTAGAMSFVELEQEVTAIAVSHDRKHVAVVECAGPDNAASRISVFRLDPKEGDGGGIKGTPVKVLSLAKVPVRAPCRAPSLRRRRHRRARRAALLLADAARAAAVCAAGREL